MHRYGDFRDRIQVISVHHQVDPDIDHIMGEYSDIFTDKDQPIGFCNVMPLEIDTRNAGGLIGQRAYRAPLTKKVRDRKTN